MDTARLQPLAYEEVESDVRERLWWQPVLVVALSGMGLGTAELGTLTPLTALYSVVLALAGWLLWSGLVFAIGVRLLPAPDTYATWGQVLRTTAFSTGPGILGFLGVFRALTGFIFAVLAIWILVAAVIAVKQALDYASTLRALGVCAIGWGIAFAGAWLLVTSP